MESSFFLADPMEALVYEGPGKITLADKPKPELQAPSDAMMRVTLTTICGTDLHIIKGDVPSCEPGQLITHRFKLDDILTAYDTFRNAAKTQAPTLLSPQQLSELLWAADSINRPEAGGHTAPSAHGLNEIDLYVALPEGVYQYEPVVGWPAATR